MNTSQKSWIFSCLIFLTFLSSCGLFSPGAKKIVSKNLAHQPFDAIIVPGVPFFGENWDPVMKIRVHWSKYLYDQGYVKNIIYSGGAVYSPYYEGKVMALYGEALGIPKEHIFAETGAEHSVENVYNCYQVAKKHNFKNIALASDPFQTRNLKGFIKKFDLPIHYLPIIFDTLKIQDQYEPIIQQELARVQDPNWKNIKERESLGKRLRGTFARWIVWKEEDLKKKRHVKKFRRQGRLEEQ